MNKAEIMFKQSKKKSLEYVKEIYSQPLLSLLSDSAANQKKYFGTNKIEKCTLLSIKTGGCSEDCAYCSQSSRYSTNITNSKLLDIDCILKAANAAKENGSSFFCLSAAWRQIKDDLDFEQALKIIKKIKENVDINVCCTFGLLNENQARALKDAGVSSYNHNIDTSPNYYHKIITTRTFDDRLKTLQNVSKAGLSVCCGGILGLGESQQDRIEFIHVLINLPKIDSVVLNTLIPIPGTPLQNNKEVSLFDFLRVVATIRVIFPKIKIRFAAGRSKFSQGEQALCFLSGINSIHTGEKLLTANNCPLKDDDELFHSLESRCSFKTE